jgi:8-oxo-dGTP pyrophosphatase MutT (NUDIX family)
LFSHKGSILVYNRVDSVSNREFYRPLGGKVEFGERSRDTVKREVMEETGEPITELRFLGALENIFTYKGERFHEVDFVYDATFANRAVYESGWVDCREGSRTFRAEWRTLNEFGLGKLTLYPEEILSMASNPDTPCFSSK